MGPYVSATQIYGGWTSKSPCKKQNGGPKSIRWVFVTKGIKKHIEVWEIGMAQNNLYTITMTIYVEYWRCMLMEFRKPLPSWPTALLEGLRSTSDWRTLHWNLGRGLLDGGKDNTPKDKEEVDYCGPTKEKTYPHFNPWRDIVVGKFVVVRLEGKEVGWEKHRQ